MVQVVQVVHSTDLSEKSFKLVDGKLEPVPSKDNTVVYAKKAGAASYNPVRILWGSGEDITFEDLRDQHAAALAAEPTMTYFEMGSNAGTVALAKNVVDGGWDMTQFYSNTGAFGVTYPRARVVNKDGAPLFIDKFGAPVDPTVYVHNYNLKPEVYINLSNGAEAVFECVTPQKLRSIELITNLRVSGYAQPILKGVFEYTDGTVVTGKLTPYNNNWYMADIVDQTKRLIKATLSVDNAHAAAPAMQKTQTWLDTATGTLYSDASLPEAAAFTPVVSVAYMYGYVYPDIQTKFYSLVKDLVNITQDCEVRANLPSATVAANLPIPELVDGNSDTVFKTTATSNALTFAISPVSGKSFKKLMRLNIVVDVPAGTEAVAKSINSVVVATMFGTRNGNSTSNTRHLRIEDTDIVDGKVTLLFNAAFANTYPDNVEKLTVALSKTVAGAWNINSISLLGSMR